MEYHLIHSIIYAIVLNSYLEILCTCKSDFIYLENICVQLKLVKNKQLLRFDHFHALGSLGCMLLY